MAMGTHVRMARAWHTWMTQRELAPGTIDKRMAVLRRLRAEVGPVHRVAADDIAGWLSARPVTARTRATDLSHLRNFYKWALANDLLVVDPTAKVPSPRIRNVPTPRWVPLERVEAVLDDLDQPERSWVALAAYNGLRCIEIARLRPEHLVDGWLHVHGKGSKWREVPLADPAADVLEQLERWWDPVAPHNVSHRGGGAMRAAGLNATMHQLRHTFGFTLADADQPARVIQELMGHASPATTAIYTDVTRAQKARSVATVFQGQGAGRRWRQATGRPQEEGAASGGPPDHDNTHRNPGV